MAFWSKADVRAVAPEFTATADGTIDLWIGYAEPQVNADVFGGSMAVPYKFAGILLTAHLLTIMGPGSTSAGASGPVTSRSVGQVSVNYADLSKNSLLSLGLGQSKYGVQLAQMIRNAGVSPQVL